MVQAARDMYLAAVLLEAEEEIKQGRNRLVELVTVPRNRRAMLGSFVVMYVHRAPAFLVSCLGHAVLTH